MSLQRYLQDHRRRHLDELIEFLRIPSVSADPDHRADVRRAAEYVQRRLEAAGLTSRLHETPGHPVVTAERRVSGDAPTVLIYGHYDVQPADPLELWDSPPFEPVIEDGKIIARGASDDKGQVYAHIKGVEALLANDSELPLNILFLVEGEEEVSSVHLDEFVERNREFLQADVVVISDGAMIAPDTPTLTYGLRGIAYVELRVRTASRDLHSGAYGGAVPNPIHVLADMLSSLHDAEGRVTLPGFYDRVREPSEEERRALAQVPFDDERYLADVGVSRGYGEAGRSTLERLWTRPTLDANGIGGGFQGEGSKTVIPASAMAKISCRLVPDQDPNEVTRTLIEYLPTLAPAGVEVEVEDLSNGWPAITSLDSPYLKAAAAALEEAFGRTPSFVRSGGTIPVVSTFQRVLGADVVLLDMGLESDRVHSPNERFDLDNYYRGILASAGLLRRLGRR